MRSRELFGYLRPSMVAAAARDGLDAAVWRARLGHLPADGHGLGVRVTHDAPAPTFLPRQYGQAGSVPKGSLEPADAALAAGFLAHRFTLLGCPLPGGARLPWHDDWAAPYTYEQLPTRLLRRRVGYAPGFDRGIDCKRPWELGRLQHLPLLAHAAATSGHVECARVVLDDVADFVLRNPPGLGVQWLSTMDVAIRAANLSWALARLGLVGEHGPRTRFLASLLAVHGEFIERHLENSGVVANHYLADLAGLVFIGWALDRHGAGSRWWRLGIDELCAQVLRQFNSDGSNFEASIPYHRLSLELTLYPLAAAMANGEKVPHEVKERLLRALGFVAAYSQPDGCAPMIGDGDDGRLFVLSNQTFEHKNRHEYLLSTGAVVLGSADLARQASNCAGEAVALLGPTCRTRLADLAARGSSEAGVHVSEAFPDGGLYVLRQDDLHMTVRVGSVGQGGNGGHSHNDALSLTLHALGYPWIVDPGTSSYTDDYARRNRMRSTRAHNTVVVDDQETRPFDPQRIFRLPEVANPAVKEWAVTHGEVRLVAEHYGFARLPGHIVHRRSIQFDRRARSWAITDRLEGFGRHCVEFLLHLAADDVSYETGAPGTVLVRATRAGVGAVVADIQLQGAGWVEVEPSLSDATMYPSYNRAQSVQLFTLRAMSDFPLCFATRITVEAETGA